jgi:hypothetical protein
MKMLYIFFIIHKVEPYFIKNRNSLKCANCKFFIPTNNKCSIFGDNNIITNEYNYEDAIVVRKDDTKCGEDAIFFKQNYFKFITIPYYCIVENNTIILLFGSIALPYIILFLIPLTIYFL